MNRIDRIILWLLTVLVFVVPLQTAYIFEAVGNSMQQGVVSFTLLDGIVALLSAAVIVRMARGKECALNGYAKLFFICGILFIFFAALSAAWSSESIIALLGAVRLAEALIVGCLLVAYQKYSTYFIVSLILAATIQSFLAIWQFILQTSPAASWFGMAYHSSQQLGDAVVEVFDQRWLRAYGTLPHPNVLAALLSSALFSCASLVGRIQSKNIFFMLLGAWVVCIAGLFFTFSREVWLGTLFGIGVLVVLRKSYRFRINIISPSMILFLTAIMVWASLSVVYWEPLSARLGVGGWQRLEQKSIHERLTSYADGWSLVKSSPFLGVGMHQSTFAIEKRNSNSSEQEKKQYYQPPHNMFLLVVSELGIVGLFLFLVLIICALKNAWSASGVCAPIALGIVCMVVISGLFDHFYWSLQSGLLLWWIAFAFLHADDTLVT